MQDYNTIIGAIQMRLNKCPTRSVMDRFRIGSSTLNLIMSRYKALELTIDELETPSTAVRRNFYNNTDVWKSKYLLCRTKFYRPVGQWNLKFHFRGLGWGVFSVEKVSVWCYNKPYKWWKKVIHVINLPVDEIFT